MAIEIHTGLVPGRIVWGHPAKSKPKTQKNPQTGGNEVVIKDGHPVQQWSFGVAFPKDHFQSVIWPAMAQEAATGYPNGVPRNFSWKYVDGDSVDNRGQPYSLREGYAGCIVLAISTEAFAPPIYKQQNGAYVQVPPEGIKCGDYVALALTLKCNVPANATHTPGLYINPQALELVAYGTEIVGQGGVDPNAVFGGKQYQLPPGATTEPQVTMGNAAMPGTGTMPGMAAPAGMPGMAPAGMAAPAGMPGMAAPAGMPGMAAPAGMPGMAPAGMPGQMPAPAHDFVNGAPGQMPGQMPGR